MPSEMAQRGRAKKRIVVANHESTVLVREVKGEDLVTIEPGPALYRRVSDESSADALTTVVGDYTKLLINHAADSQDHILSEASRASLTAATQVLQALTGEDSHIALTRLQQKRRDAIIQTTTEIVGRLTTVAYEQVFNDDALERCATVASAIVRIMLSADRAEMDTLFDALVPLLGDPDVSADDEQTDDEAELEDIRDRQQVRLFELYRGVMNDSTTVKRLREDWGITRQRIAQLRSEQKLFAIKVPYHRELFYPNWQFGLDRQPRPEMPALLALAQECKLDPIEFHEFMTRKHPQRPTGVELLDQGRVDDVSVLIRAADR